MPFKKLLPSIWRERDVPVRYEEAHPFYGLQREMNRLFEDFSRGFDIAPFGTMSERMRAFSPYGQRPDIERGEKRGKRG
ncbi:MAG: hypothetical protein FJ139_06750 [Deltaproteobacteria bacterium]|nr:hypothetical protein [Deltaproteobacteria bacterium]